MDLSLDKQQGHDIYVTNSENVMNGCNNPQYSIAMHSAMNHYQKCIEPLTEVLRCMSQQGGCQLEISQSQNKLDYNQPEQAIRKQETNKSCPLVYFNKMNSWMYHLINLIYMYRVVNSYSCMIQNFQGVNSTSNMCLEV